MPDFNELRLDGMLQPVNARQIQGAQEVRRGSIVSAIETVLLFVELAFNATGFASAGEVSRLFVRLRTIASSGASIAD
jgi:hypothetical protein